MKRFFLLFSLVIMCVCVAMAQAPEKMTYQAVVRNSANSLVANQNVTVRLSILLGSAQGAPVYVENHTAATNDNGLMTVEIGGGAPTTGVFANIDWANGPYFLKSEIDPTGGINYSIESVQQLMSVPYALYAKEAGNGFSGDYNDLTNKPTFTESQILSISNDTIYLTGGSFVKLPAGFDGDYNSLTNRPNLFSGAYNDLTGKPNLAPVATSGEYNDLTGKPNLAPVATSGNYNDLTNKPTLFDGNYNSLSNRPILFSGNYNDLTNKPNLFDGDYNSLTNRPNLAPVAISGNYNDLLNKPVLFDGNYNSLTNRPNLAPVATSGNYSDLTNKPNLATVATSGSYNDLSNRPAIPAEQVNADWNATSGKAQIINKPNLAPVATSGSYNDITGKPNLAPVATSGNYNDLTNRPQIPTVPTNVSAFTNDAGYITMDSIPTIPTNVSAFQNDAGYITQAAVPTNVSQLQNDAGYLTSFTEQQILTISNDTIYLTGGSFVKLPAGFDGDYNSLTNKPTIPIVPTDVSAFTNDAGYITMDSIPSIPTNVSQLQNDVGYLTSFTESQILTISNDTIYLTGGSYVKLPAGFDGDYNSLTNKPTIPLVPTNVSAFTNDAGYITQAAVPTNVSQLQNDAGYITMDSIPTIPTIPTNVSAFQNDAGYLTSFTEQQILSISNDTIYLTGGSYVKLPAGFDGDYNSLTNKPTIPIVPTDVSAFTNDAGYITVDSIPAIPTIPTNVSAFQNDAGYLTSFTEQQILSISNDTIYLTGGSFVKLPAGFDGDYNSLTNKPTNVSAFTNDAGYITMDSIPAIPTVPTNVSAFTNDAGYITQASVPTNVSQLQNDAGYITMDSIPAIPTIPTNVSAFQNDAGYLTSFTEQQILTISNDTIYLTGGSYVKLPAGFDGDYNSLTNKPTIPIVPTDVSAFTNDAGYITMDSIPTIPTIPTNVSAFQNDAGYLTSFTEQQILSISNDTIYLTGGSFVKLPAGFDGDYNSLTNKPNLAPVASSGSYNDITNKPNLAPVATSGDYNDLTNRPTIPAAQVNSDWNATSGVEEILNKPTNVSAFTNDAGYLTSDSLANLNNQLDSLQQALNNLQQIMEDDHFLCGTSTVTDVDGNTYNTVRIGEQCWMRENLRTTHYADGTDIPLGTDTSSTIPYRYNPDNNASNVPIYGYLYNWPALMHGEASSKSNPSGVQGICPDAWHVPSEAEWNQLTTAVSNYNGFICSDDIGNIAKALSDTIGWYNSDITPNYHAYDCVVGNDLSANNATGFSALPAGKFYLDYSYFGRETRFWCTNQAMDSYAMCKYLYYNGAVVHGAGNPKSFGFSVRCLRDSRSVGDYLQGVSEQIEAQREQIETQQSEVLCPSTVTDVDGNTYNIVRIGEQCWMRENLRTTRYADGTAIPFGGTSLSSVTPYRYVPNNNENNVVTYGYLYNWPAVMHGAASSSTNPSGVQGICPTGWHVPSTAEWDQLTTMVSRHREYICDGNPTNCAKALSATTGWNNSTYDCVVGNDLSANNATGFSALPAGGSHSRSRLFGEVAYFWSSTQYTVSSAYNRYLSNIDSFVGESYQDEFLGLSVRCLRDNRSVGDYLQGLGEQIEAQQHILDSLAPVAFSGDYNDLINTPPIPAEQVNADWNATSGKAEILNKPTNVSAFANDAGYITMDSIPAIPTIPTNVSAFINDAGYVTVANVQQAANIPTNVSAFTNDAGYITMDSIPSIPTIPTNVSAFQNDAGYLTSFTEQQILTISNDTIYLTGGSYVKLPAGFDGDYNSLTNKPNLAPVATSGSYNDITNKPNLAPVATSGDYNSLTNKPNIPVVPTDVSVFTNDAGYITQAAVPTNVSQLQNDAGYLTSFTEQQILSISNDTIYLTGGSYVKLPAGFDGDYNSLTNKPNLAPVATTGSYNDITGKPNLAPVATSGNYNDLTNTPTIPAAQVNSDWNAITGVEEILNKPTNVSAFNNDAGYLTSDSLASLNDQLAAQQSEVDSLSNQLAAMQHALDSLQQVMEDDHFLCGTSTITDVDGNTYNTVRIGEQCWMKENLRTTKYANGNTIMQGDTTSATIGYWYYPNNDSTNKVTYGLLYNWTAVMNGTVSSNSNPSGVQGICPDGWHVPSDAEWAQLTMTVSSNNGFICNNNPENIAKALAATIHWYSSSYDCAVGNDLSTNNVTGFSALPASYYNGFYDYFGNEANFWSATEDNDYLAYSRLLYYNSANVSGYNPNKFLGLSVRCVRDNRSVGDCLQGVSEQIAAQQSEVLCPSTMKDYDGNTYNTVRIGKQCWMRENLRTTHYADGTPIEPGDSTSYTTPHRYAPANNETTVPICGYLYNWPAVMHGVTSSEANPSGVQDICPKGWHVPRDVEWTQLTTTVSSNNEYICNNNHENIAKALADTIGWYSSTYDCVVGNDLSANNATGFSALPAVNYGNHGSGNYGYGAVFWSATEASSTLAYNRSLSYNNATVGRRIIHKYYGYSVRCLRDNTTVSEQVDAQQHILDSLAPVAFSGDYNDLSNTPTIPTNVSAFSNDAGYVTQTQLNNANYITNTGSSCGNSVDLCSLLRRLDSLENRLQNMTTPNTSSEYGMPLNDTCPRRMIVIDGAHNVCYSDANNVFMLVFIDGGVDENASYVWYRNGRLPNNPDAIAFANMYGENVAPTYNDPVKYTVKVTTTDGCSYLSAPFEVNVYDPPYTTITGDSNICVGGSVTLRANLQNSNNQMITFQWYENGLSNANRLSGRTHETETFTPSSGTTTYYVEVTHQMNADAPCAAYDTYRVHVDSCGANGGNNGDGGGEISAVDGQPCPGTPTVTDHEGNVYATVQIGNQCWMRENLRTTTSPTTGTYLIPPTGTPPSYSGKQARWYNNDSTTYAPQGYGLLYNWNAAVDTFDTRFGETSVKDLYDYYDPMTFTGHRRGICPEGWHLPSDAEWNTMEALVSGLDWQPGYETTTNERGLHAGNLAGGDNWYSSSTHGAPGDYGNAERNSSGFSAVPAGGGSSSFYHAGDNAYFWSSSQSADYTYHAWTRYLFSYLTGVIRQCPNTCNLLSVRCLRDN